MPPLGSIFRSSTCRPKVDQHSLFTSIQVSVPILQGTLQVYEPWKKKRVKAKPCHVTLYSNDTSPFLVWSKAYNSTSGKSPLSPTSHSVTGAAKSATSPDSSSSGKPRCVLPVSRAKVTKTTGGCFEVVDFSTSSLFRFVAPTIRESEIWVERLKEESQREANLDMGSVCSSCSSSFSSSSSHPSPVSSEYNGFHPPSPPTKAPFSRPNYQIKLNQTKSASVSEPSNLLGDADHDEYENELRLERPTELSVYSDVFSSSQMETDYSSSNQTFPRTQVNKQRHTRAQPHLGINVTTVDKQRPDLSNVLRNSNQHNTQGMGERSALPLSEFFVTLPST